MACWAAASVAMEYWQIDADELERRLKSGQTRSREGFGRTLYDLDPSPPVVTTGPTFTAIAPQAEEQLAEAIAIGDWRRSREVTAGMRRRAA